MTKKTILAALLLSAGIATAAPSFTTQKTFAGDEYGFIAQPKPGHMAIMFTTTIASSLTGEFTSIGNTLAKAGFVVVSVDVPCHGAETPGRARRLVDRVLNGKGSGEGLGCWAARVGDTEGDFFAPFIERVKRVVADMHARKLVSGNRVVAIGVSRGGYLALRAAAADERITDVVGMAPVTDLQRLDEFSKIKVNESVYGLDKYASQLAKRHLFLQIGSADGRVGTHEALRLIDAVTAAGHGEPVDLTLLLTPAPGHTTAEHDRAAKWVLDEFSGATTEAAAPPPPK